eukprot:15181219-Alexandrium_andersonii.AAC.1
MRAQVGALDASGAHGASHGLSGRVGPATEPQPRPASSSGSSWLRDAGQRAQSRAAESTGTA